MSILNLSGSIQLQFCCNFTALTTGVKAKGLSQNMVADNKSLIVNAQDLAQAFSVECIYFVFFACFGCHDSHPYNRVVQYGCILGLYSMVV